MRAITFYKNILSQSKYILSDSMQIDESVLKTDGADRPGVSAAEVNTKHFNVTGRYRIFFWRRNQGAEIKLV